MKSVWFIQAETNIHVGNENTSSVGLIDKEIQRDVLTKIPCINASSLKGAMNEYATTAAKLSAPNRLAIFGVDRNNTKDTRKGGCSFFDSYLLLLPVQDDRKLYRLVTSVDILNHYLDLLKAMGVDMGLETLKKELEKVDNHFDRNRDILDHTLFKEYCSDDELPIIARNNLTGKGNLWYEQALPHKSVFGTVLTADPLKVKYNDAEGNEKEGDVEELIDSTYNGKIVQIGANATIGYGYCKFRKIL